MTQPSTQSLADPATIPEPPLPPEAPPGEPVVQPIYVKTISDDSSLNEAVMSLDGRTVYTLSTTGMVDVGMLINQHAVACANALAVLVSITLLIWLRRAATRRRTLGAMHCRRCDYNVTAQTQQPAPRCPECGADLARKRPRRGLTAKRRLLPPLVAITCLIGATTWFAFAGHTTFPKPIPEQRWGSLKLAEWSTSPRLGWMANAIVAGELLQEVDAESGVIRRTLTARPTTTHWPIAFVPTAGPSGAVTLAGPGGSIELASLSNGRVLSSVRGFPPPNPREPDPFVTAQSTDHSKIYLNSFDSDANKSSAVEWDWKSDSARTLLTIDGFMFPGPPQAFAIPRNLFTIPGNPPRFVRIPDTLEYADGRPVVVAMLDHNGKTLFESGLSETQWVGNLLPTFTADHNSMFLIGMIGEKVESFSTRSLAKTGEFSMWGDGSDGLAWYWSTLRADGRILAVPTHRYIRLRDLQAEGKDGGAWVGRLAHPDGTYAPHSIVFSADGRAACAVFMNNTVGYQLAVWRLPESLALGAGNDTAPAPAKN